MDFSHEGSKGLYIELYEVCIAIWCPDGGEWMLVWTKKSCCYTHIGCWVETLPVTLKFCGCIFWQNGCAKPYHIIFVSVFALIEPTLKRTLSVRVFNTKTHTKEKPYRCDLAITHYQPELEKRNLISGRIHLELILKSNLVSGSTHLELILKRNCMRVNMLYWSNSYKRDRESVHGNAWE